jgi:hypothetical protein
VGTKRSGQAGARTGSWLTPKRVAEPPAAHRETFLEMLWRIVKQVVKNVVRAVGVQR